MSFLEIIFITVSHFVFRRTLHEGGQGASAQHREGRADSEHP
jgi:hypothetical protein